MPAEEHFEPEAVQRVIRRAMQNDTPDTIHRDDLIAAAREAGIDDDAITRAIDEESAAIQQDRRQRERRQRVIAALSCQARRYALILGALFFVDLFSPGPWWVQWPALGMAIALAVRAGKVW